MKGYIRRRFIAAGFLSFVTVGCNASSNRPANEAKSASPPSLAQQAASREDSEEKEAQRIWCEYLDVLHRRADEAHAGLPSLQQCLSARTYASPKMLRHTAVCSREALEKTDGDPFNEDYAAAVARCGSDALDACEAPKADLEPFVSAICSCMDRCGDASYEQCTTGAAGAISPHLSRAIGAMNTRGRQAFEGCLKKLDCGDVGSQIVQCLDPIMDNLLWLPE